MRRKIFVLLVVMMLAGFSACGRQEEAAPSAPGTADERPGSGEAEQEDRPDAEGQEGEPGAAEQEGGPDMQAAETTEPDADAPGAEKEDAKNTGAGDGNGRILIAYFTMPEDVDTSGVDAVAGASIVVRENEALGNTEYVARLIQQTIGGDLFQIETKQQYPLDHDPLVDLAAEEQDADARPELSSHIENPGQYDVIVLGFPNWWGDLPQPLYTFLEEYDFGGKTIIPFVTHGGSGFSDTVNTIADLQRDASVSENTLSLSRNAVAESEADVIAWAKSLGL